MGAGIICIFFLCSWVLKTPLMLGAKYTLYKRSILPWFSPWAVEKFLLLVKETVFGHRLIWDSGFGVQPAEAQPLSKHHSWRETRKRFLTLKYVAGVSINWNFNSHFLSAIMIAQMVLYALPFSSVLWKLVPYTGLPNEKVRFKVSPWNKFYLIESMF